jgi:hypothetical protein
LRQVRGICISLPRESFIGGTAMLATLVSQVAGVLDTVLAFVANVVGQL